MTRPHNQQSIKIRISSDFLKSRNQNKIVPLCFIINIFKLKLEMSFNKEELLRSLSQQSIRKSAIKEELMPSSQPLNKPTRDISASNNSQSLSREDLFSKPINRQFSSERRILLLQRQIQQNDLERQANIVYNRQFKALAKLFGDQQMNFDELRFKAQNILLHENVHYHNRENQSPKKEFQSQNQKLQERINLLEVDLSRKIQFIQDMQIVKSSMVNNQTGNNQHQYLRHIENQLGKKSKIINELSSDSLSKETYIETLNQLQIQVKNREDRNFQLENQINDLRIKNSTHIHGLEEELVKRNQTIQKLTFDVDNTRRRQSSLTQEIERSKKKQKEMIMMLDKESHIYYNGIQYTTNGLLLEINCKDENIENLRRQLERQENLINQMHIQGEEKTNLSAKQIQNLRKQIERQENCIKQMHIQGEDKANLSAKQIQDLRRQMERQETCIQQISRQGDYKANLSTKQIEHLKTQLERQEICINQMHIQVQDKANQSAKYIEQSNFKHNEQFNQLKRQYQEIQSKYHQELNIISQLQAQIQIYNRKIKQNEDINELLGKKHEEVFILQQRIRTIEQQLQETYRNQQFSSKKITEVNLLLDKKNENYQKTIQELQENENKYRILSQQLQEEISSYQQKMNEQKIQNEQTISNHEMQINNFFAERRDYENHISNYQTQISSYQTQINKYQTQINNYQTQINNYQTQINSYEIQINNYDVQINNYQTDLRQFKEAHLQKEQYHASKNIRLSQQSNNLTYSLSPTLEKNEIQVSRQLIKHSSEVEQIKIDELEIKLRQIVLQKSQLQEEIQSVSKRYHDLEQQFDTNNYNMRQKQQMIVKMQSQLQQNNHYQIELEETLNLKQQKIKNNLEDLTRRQITIASLEIQIKKYVQDIQAFQRQCQVLKINQTTIPVQHGNNNEMQHKYISSLQQQNRCFKLQIEQLYEKIKILKQDKIYLENQLVEKESHFIDNRQILSKLSRKSKLSDQKNGQSQIQQNSLEQKHQSQISLNRFEKDKEGRSDSNKNRQDSEDQLSRRIMMDPSKISAQQSKFGAFMNDGSKLQIKENHLFIHEEITNNYHVENEQIIKEQKQEDSIATSKNHQSRSQQNSKKEIFNEERRNNQNSKKDLQNIGINQINEQIREESKIPNKIEIQESSINEKQKQQSQKISDSQISIEKSLQSSKKSVSQRSITPKEPMKEPKEYLPQNSTKKSQQIRNNIHLQNQNVQTNNKQNIYIQKKNSLIQNLDDENNRSISRSNNSRSNSNSKIKITYKNPQTIQRVPIVQHIVNNVPSRFSQSKPTISPSNPIISPPRPIISPSNRIQHQRTSFGNIESLNNLSNINCNTATYNSIGLSYLTKRQSQIITPQMAKIERIKSPQSNSIVFNPLKEQKKQDSSRHKVNQYGYGLGEYGNSGKIVSSNQNSKMEDKKIQIKTIRRSSEKQNQMFSSSIGQRTSTINPVQYNPVDTSVLSSEQSGIQILQKDKGVDCCKP